MPDRISTSPVSTLFVDYWRSFAGCAGVRLWFGVALLIVIAVLEGSGLLLLLPLLQSIGVASVGKQPAFPALQAWGLPTTLPFVLALFVGLKALQAGLRAWSAVFNAKLETHFVSFLRERFYRAMMESNWLFLTRQRSSDLSHVLLEELPAVGFGTLQLLMLLSVAAIALVQVFVAWTLSPVMTALAVLIGGSIVIALRRFRARSHAFNESGRGKFADMAAVINEHLSGMKLAKSQGREAHHRDRFHRTMEEIAGHTIGAHRLHALIQFWTELAAVIAMAAFIYFAVGVRQVEPARLIVLAFILTRLLSHASTLQGLWTQFVRSLPSFAATEKLHACLTAAAEPQPSSIARRIPLQREIHLHDISVHYDPAAEGRAAVHRLDLVIPARQVTAFCGPSGAGKSTVADVLLGLLAPTTGEVLIDCEKLADQRLHDWRQSVGYVPQETFLFHETIRANLLWARPEATEPELRAALHAAAAAAFVDQLPQGLDTVVGDRGVRLSGGERQRIALARALLRRPALLVLDEATSALDAENERLIQEAIENLQGELTIVLIAHRLSTVRLASRIAVLENGMLAETGTWQELCAREQGVFARLVAANTKP